MNDPIEVEAKVLAEEKECIKVSIIMPSLNVGMYIREALESVCRQTLKEIEIICVDAGSTDDTVAIIKEFVRQDNRVRLIESDKKSYGRQLNLGIAAATGKYLGIVETDDIVSERMYEQLYNVAEANKAEIAKADYFRFTGDGESRKFEQIPCASDKGLYDKVIDPSKDKRAFRFTIICGNIYSLDFIRNSAIRFNETPGASYQDIGFFYQTNSYAHRVVFVNEPFYMYRQDNPNSSINNKGKVFACCTEYAWLRKQLRRKMNVYAASKTSFGRGLYHGYMNTLRRISSKFRAEFIERFSLDLLAANTQGELDKNLFSPRDWANIQEIMANPKAFLAKNFPLSDDAVTVSVIIPVYNAAEYLGKCLDSVLAQDLFGIEVICVDDGSTDASPEILKMYAESHKNLIVLTQANGNASVARNRALEVANGEFVAFMDSDDLYPSHNVLSRLYNIAKQEHVSAVGGQLERFAPQTPDKIEHPKMFPFLHLGLNIYDKAPFDFCYQLFIFEKRLISDNGIRFPIVTRYQDPPFMAKVMYAARVFYMVDFPTYRYRFGHQNINWVKDDYRKARDMIRSMSEVVRFAVAKGLDRLIEMTKYRIMRDYSDVLFGQIPDVTTFPEFQELIDLFPEDVAKSIKEHICSVMLNDILDRNNALEILKHLESSSCVGALELVSALAQRYFARRDVFINKLDRISYVPRIHGNGIRTIGFMYYNMHTGGVQKVLAVLAKIMFELGYKVVFIIEEPLDDESVQMPNEVVVRYLVKSSACNPSNISTRVHQLADIITVEKIDAIYYHSYSSHLFIWDLLTAKIVCRVPFIAHFHSCVGTALYNISSVPDFAYLAARTRMCDKVITLSRNDETFFKVQGVNAQCVINPADPVLQTISLPPVNIRFEKKTIVWCARMSYEKCPLEAIAIFDEVHKVIPDAKMIMVGGGNEILESRVVGEVEKRGLKDCVELTGNQNDPHKYYAEGSVFLLTSVFEGFALTLVEAGFHGLPSVMYRLPFLETVRRNSGIVQVEQHDIKGAALAICNLFSDEQEYRRMADANRIFMRNLTSSDLLRIFKKIFNELQFKKQNGRSIVPQSISTEEIRIMMDEFAYCYANGFYTLKSQASAPSVKQNVARLTENKLVEKIHSVEKQNQELKIKHENRKRKISKLEKELKSIKKSESYRLGKCLLYPLRAIKKLVSKA